MIAGRDDLTNLIEGRVLPLKLFNSKKYADNWMQLKKFNNSKLLVCLKYPILSFLFVLMVRYRDFLWALYKNFISKDDSYFLLNFVLEHYKNNFFQTSKNSA